MVALAVQQISMTPSVTQTTSVPDTGGSEGVPANTVPPGDRVFLEFENTGTAKTITVYVPASAGLDAYGTAFADLSYSLGATTGRRRIGPLDPKFANPATGLIGFTIDVNTGVTVAALRS